MRPMTLDSSLRELRAPRSGRSYRLNRVLSHGLLYLLLIAGSFVILFPFLWMLSSSFKPDKDIFNFPIQWIPPNLFPQNYVRVWNNIHYGRLLANTTFLTTMVTGLQILTCTLAGYAFAKIQFPENRILFVLYLATLMVPYQVVMIPQFTIIRLAGLMNSHWAIILIQAFSPFGVFMMRQFFLNIPMELSEAARIDGLGELGIYWRIIMPLSKPALASLAIFTAVFVWNDFLTPLIYLNSASKWTIQLGLRSLFAEYTADYGGVMAGAVLAILPVLVLYLFLQRFFIEGIAMSGIKG
jgi:multiple sugar transport system permease protein